jgi:hypothetical protein
MTNSFHGSLPRASPLTSNLANRAFDYVFGSMIPRPLWVVKSANVSHLTLACASASLPPQMKFLTTPLTWAHIRGMGFQHAARYHIEARRTWFPTRILPAKDKLLWLQLMSLLLRASIILSKFASGGRWEPTWIPRYRVSFPFGTHLRSTYAPPSSLCDPKKVQRVGFAELVRNLVPFPASSTKRGRGVVLEAPGLD